MHKENVSLPCLHKEYLRKMEALKCHTFRIVVLLELFLPLMRLTAPASDDKPYKTIKLYVSVMSSRQLFELTAQCAEA